MFHSSCEPYKCEDLGFSFQNAHKAKHLKICLYSPCLCWEMGRGDRRIPNGLELGRGMDLAQLHPFTQQWVTEILPQTSWQARTYPQADHQSFIYGLRHTCSHIHTHTHTHHKHSHINTANNAIIYESITSISGDFSENDSFIKHRLAGFNVGTFGRRQIPNNKISAKWIIRSLEI